MEIMILLSLLFIILLANIEIEKRGGYRDDYLSLNTSSAWKGIAACFILIHHISKEVVTGGIFQILNYIAFPMVAIFLFYSGYGMVNGIAKKTGYLDCFLKVRFKKVMSPYYIVAIIATIVETVILHKELYFDDILTLIIGGKYWFVFCIMIVYLIFYITQKIGMKYALSDNIRILMFTSGILLYCVVCFLLSLSSQYTASMSAAVLGVLLGYKESCIIQFIRRKYVLNTVLLIIAFVLVFIGRLGLAYVGVQNEIIHTALRNIISATFIFCLIAISQKVGICMKRIMCFLCDLSYEMYLCSVPLIDNTCDKFAHYAGYSIVICVTTIFIAYILHRIAKGKRVLSKA